MLTGQGQMKEWYAIVFVIIACASKIICLCDYIVMFLPSEAQCHAGHGDG